MKTYVCSKCKKEKDTSQSILYMYPGEGSNTPRVYVCAECHKTKLNKLKKAAKEKLPGGRFGLPRS